MRRSVLIFLAVLFCRPGLAYTLFSANKAIQTDPANSSGIYVDTTNALWYIRTNAQDGWTITNGNAGGSYVMTNTLAMPPGLAFTFAGFPNNRPTLTFSNGPAGWGSGITTSGNTYSHLFTLQDLAIHDAHNGPGTSDFAIAGDGVCFRILNCFFFDNTNANSVGTIGQFNTDINSGPWGLLSHCDLISSGGSIYGFFCRANGNSGNGNTTSSLEWTRPMTWGTSNAVYFEDCRFIAQTLITGRPGVDGASGCRYVIRHCFDSNYVTLTMHGPDSGGISNSTLQVEHYYCTNQVSASQGMDFSAYQRGGSIYSFSNKLVSITSGFYNAFLKMSVDCADSGWAGEACPRQYTYPADYPVYQQVGQGVIAPNTVGYVPSWIWSNDISSASVSFGYVEFGDSDGSFMQANRDYFLNQGPATNYTPYVYPHPLAAGQPADPSIQQNPQNQTVTAPATANFSVTASGQTALSYQWSKNGTQIPGATQASYTTPATSYPADNGSTFYVVVTDTAGSLQSSTATLTVNPSGGGGGSLVTKTYSKSTHGQSSR